MHSPHTEQQLIQMLADAQRLGRHDIDAALFDTLDRPAAYRMQAGVLDQLGETVGMLKTAVHPDGVGVAAPIFASRVGTSGAFQLPVANVVGLEVEVGVVLGRDLGSADDIELVEAIDHYFVGIEICGSRFIDRSKASPSGGLADNMSALGYVIDRGPRDPGADIEGFDVRLEFNGAEIHSAPARHSFGTVLASLVAYARNQHPAYPLKAGTIVTTGSLCGLVPTSGPGRVVGQLGAHEVAFDLV